MFVCSSHILVHTYECKCGARSKYIFHGKLPLRMYNFDKSVAPLSAVLAHIYLSGYFIICLPSARYSYHGYGAMPNVILENTVVSA